MNSPGKENCKAVQWILRYLRGTTSYALCFGGSDTVLEGYVDVDMVGDKDSRRSTIGNSLTVGGPKVSWILKKGCCTFNNGSKLCFYYKGY